MKICTRALLVAAILAVTLHAQTVNPTRPQILYVGNNSSRNISAYKINSSTGTLTEIPGSPFAVFVSY